MAFTPLRRQDEKVLRGNLTMQILSNMTKFSTRCAKITSIDPGGYRYLFFCGLGICFLSMFFTGCSTANLISEKAKAEYKQVDENISFTHIRQEILGNIDPFGRYKEGLSMNVTASDIWESTFIRWLTPLDENDQKFQARLRLYHQGIEFTFLNGDQKGRTIGFDGRSYESAELQKVYKESTAISLYLESLQNYFEWHQTLLRSPGLEVMGTKEIENVSYLVVYVTSGTGNGLDTYDQYLIYLNTRDKRIDYIEFTMRELMKSYKGVIHYRNHKMVEGILMPFWIGIGADLPPTKLDHYFLVETIDFDSSDE